MNEKIAVNYSGVTELPIKMSKLLKKMKKKQDLRFICHTANKIFKKKSGVTGFDAMTNQTFNEFRRLMPNHIKTKLDSVSLCNWTKNLPNHLKAQYPIPDNRQFRIDFLTWAIEKYGDQEIVFHFRCV